MKSTSHTRMLCALAATLAVESVTISAQTTKPSVGPPGAASSPSPASAGLVNDWLREQARSFDPFDLGGQFRARFVDQTYFAVPGAGATAVDFRANTPESANDFLLLLSAVSAGPVAAEKASARSGRWRRCRSWSAPHRGRPRLWRAAQLRSGGAVSPLHVFPGWCIVAPITVFDYIGLFNAAMLTRSPTLIVEHQEFYNQNFQVPEGPPDHRVRRGTAKVLREQIERSGSRALKKWRLPK